MAHVFIILRFCFGIFPFVCLTEKALPNIQYGSLAFVFHSTCSQVNLNAIDIYPCVCISLFLIDSLNWPSNRIPSAHYSTECTQLGAKAISDFPQNGSDWPIIECSELDPLTFAAVRINLLLLLTVLIISEHLNQ